MRFYLGTPEPSWLGRLDVPLFVSRTRLQRRAAGLRARADWAMDSGGFTEIERHGRWTISADAYAETVAEIAETVGRLEWAAPQDWMCEPKMIAASGLSVREHQDRTVQNYLDLRDCGPFIPVLQGWTITDYERCVDLYATAGVDLERAPLVGLGSVCRRQATHEIASLVRDLAGHGMRLHGFGVKVTGIAAYGDRLASADSMAWSYDARRRAGRGEPSPVGCAHRSCANCDRFALEWRSRVVRRGVQLAIL